MDKSQQEQAKAHKDAPVRTVPVGGAGGAELHFPKQKLDCARCEQRLVLGIFFDGTNNNRDADLPRFAHSNVARLYAAYPNALDEGYGRVYIPGVGTPFDEVRDKGGTLGNAFGAGGEARILYALLSLFNAVDNWLVGKKRIRPGTFFSDDQMRALCANGPLYQHTRGDGQTTQASISPEDLAVLKTVRPDGLNMDEKGGLLTPALGRNRWREEFFKNQLLRIKQRLDETTTPALKEITLDVFGFSRGAAQARAFCNHVFALLAEGGGEQLFGVKFSIRFLGIFDTVASVGVQSGMFGYTTGHSAWADPDVMGGLTIHDKVHWCEHFVSMHEGRASFPLDSAARRGGSAVPADRGRELAYPGSHSDVGGGYAPGELGLHPGASRQEQDAHKLSQIALDHMYQAALGAGVPLNKSRVLTPAAKSGSGDGGDGYDSFAFSPEVVQAFNAFLQSLPGKASSTQAYLLPYLKWWHLHLNNFQALDIYRNASAEEKKLYEQVQRKLYIDCAQRDQSRYDSQYGMYMPKTTAQEQQGLVMSKVHGDYEVLDLIRLSPDLSEPQKTLFAHYVHDSMTGFAATVLEPTGRLRWRRVFRGTESAQLARTGSVEPARTA